MPLLTATQRALLLANGRANAARIKADQTPHDFVPVVKLFTPDPDRRVSLRAPASPSKRISRITASDRGAEPRQAKLPNRATADSAASQRIEKRRQKYPPSHRMPLSTGTATSS